MKSKARSTLYGLPWYTYVKADDEAEVVNPVVEFIIAFNQLLTIVSSSEHPRPASNAVRSVLEFVVKYFARALLHVVALALRSPAQIELVNRSGEYLKDRCRYHLVAQYFDGASFLRHIKLTD